MDNTTNVISKSPERNTEGATVEVVIPAIGEQREMLVQVRTSNNSIRTCSLNPGLRVDEIVIGHDVVISENEIYRVYQIRHAVR